MLAEVARVGGRYAAPVTYSEGTPLLPWLFIAGLVWLGLQLRPKKRKVWAARFVAVTPVLVYLMADLTAILNALFYRREVRRSRADLDKGLEDLLGDA